VVDGLDGFLDSSLIAGGGGERSKPKRKYETVNRSGSSLATATKGEPTFINIGTTTINTTDPPASR
jgi:hypothetical protein